MANQEGDMVAGKGVLMPDGSYSSPTVPVTPAAPVTPTPPPTSVSPITTDTKGNSISGGTITSTTPSGTGGGNTATISYNKNATPATGQNNITAPYGTDPNTGVPYGAPGSNDANPNTNTPTNTSGTSTYNGATLNSDQTNYTNTINGLSTQITNLANGSTPLTAGEQAQIDSLKAQFEQEIQTQGLVNTSTEGTAQLRGYQSGTAEFSRDFQASVIGSVVSSGITKITNLQTQEASAIAQLTESLQSNDIKNLQAAYDTYTSAHKDVADSISTLMANTQQALNDNKISNVISSGVTDPKDILSTLQSQGYTDITADDITKDIASLSPDAAAIYSTAQTAASNGASSDTVAAIMSAPDKATALKIAAQGNVANSAVMDLIAKYPDAGIVPGDTIGQATAKIQNSPTYTAAQKAAALDNTLKQAQIASTNATTAKTEADIAAEQSNPNGNAIGTLGTSSIDVTTPGYATAPVAGGLTQSAIDQAAMQFALTGVMPSMGLGSTGAAGERRVAIQNRAAELNAGGNIQANKATLEANTKALNTQVAYLNTTQRALTNAENGLQQLTTAFSGKINNSVPLANAFANAAAYQLGSADINSYKAALLEVANEYTQVFSRGGQVSDQTRTTAQNIINGDISISDLNAVSNELQAQGNIVIQGAQGQVQSIQDQINGIISGNGTAGPNLSTFDNGGTSDPNSTSNGVDLSKF